MQPEEKRTAQLETHDGKNYARIDLSAQTKQAFTWPKRAVQIGGFLPLDGLLEIESFKEYCRPGPHDYTACLHEDALEEIALTVADASVSAYDVGYHDAIDDLGLQVLYEDEGPDA